MTTPEPVEVMIIGSGFGGAVAALRLAEQGIDAVMLERGRRWALTNEHTFSSLTDPDGRSAWLSDEAILGPPNPIDRFVGVLERIVCNDIDVFTGAGVGGGSLVYEAALVQPPKRLFQRVFGRHVDYDEMDDVYFKRVRAAIKPSPIPPAILRHAKYAAARAWADLGRKADLPTELVELGVDWRIVKKELSGERVPSVIAGEAPYGNNSGAKLSLDRNYLHRAERSRRLDIVTHRIVRSVRSGPQNRFLVTADRIDDRGSILGVEKYVVRKLFLAAGSIGTSKLLVRAKARGWLSRLNDHVGTRWGTNADFFGALEGLSADIHPNLGGTTPVLIRHLDNPVMPTTVECYADWARAGQVSAIPFIGMAPSPAKGSLVFDPAADQVALKWSAEDPEIVKATEAAAVTYKRLAEASEGDCVRREPVAPLAYGIPARRTLDADTTPVIAPFTLHPLGGVPLNRATDNVGRVRGHRGLYVIDGALIPGNTGCSNPALTIAALAERNIERIIKPDFARDQD